MNYFYCTVMCVRTVPNLSQTTSSTKSRSCMCQLPCDSVSLCAYKYRQDQTCSTLAVGIPRQMTLPIPIRTSLSISNVDHDETSSFIVHHHGVRQQHRLLPFPDTSSNRLSDSRPMYEYICILQRNNTLKMNWGWKSANPAFPWHALIQPCDTNWRGECHRLRKLSC